MYDWGIHVLKEYQLRILYDWKKYSLYYYLLILTDYTLAATSVDKQLTSFPSLEKKTK